MTVKYEYDKENNLVLTTVSDTISTIEIKNYFNDLINRNIIKPGTIEIVNISDVEDLILKHSDLKDIKKFSDSLYEDGHKATLMCAYNALSKEIANMMLPLFHSVKLNVILCSNKDEFESNLKILS